MDRQLLWAKTEVTYGVDPVAVAANTVLAEDITYKLTGQRVKPNPAKPGVGPVPSWTYGEYVEVSFSIPLIGNAAVGSAPKFGPILLACGWAETLVAVTSASYALVANPKASPSLTLVWRDDRRSHKVVGFRGRLGLKLSAGQRPMITVTGKGLHTDVTTGAALAHADAVFTDWQDARPVAQGATAFTFAAVASLGLREFSFDQSDNVKFFDLPGQESVELLGERAFTGKVKLTTPLPSALNFETLWKSGAQQTWSFTHDTVAGRIATVSGRGQVVDPGYGRDNEQDVTDFSLELNPSSLVTDNDLALVFT
ncbi:hypothetical protein [Phenylobacterium sp.]|uniref:hypothetical protein n=1 Tax=Phenylobacterium sp. TaxID=1871053 RepID=UPI002F3E292C